MPRVLRSEVLIEGFTGASASPTGKVSVGTDHSDPSQTNWARAQDLRSFVLVSAWLRATGTGTGNINVQGTNDPEGLVGWENIPYRLAPPSANPGTTPQYVTTAIAMGAGTTKNIWLDPTASPTWLRFAVDTNGASNVLTAIAHLED